MFDNSKTYFDITMSVTQLDMYTYLYSYECVNPFNTSEIMRSDSNECPIEDFDAILEECGLIKYSDFVWNHFTKHPHSSMTIKGALIYKRLPNT